VEDKIMTSKKLEETKIKAGCWTILLIPVILALLYYVSVNQVISKEALIFLKLGHDLPSDVVEDFQKAPCLTYLDTNCRRRYFVYNGRKLNIHFPPVSTLGGLYRITKVKLDSNIANFFDKGGFGEWGKTVPANSQKVSPQIRIQFQNMESGRQYVVKPTIVVERAYAVSVPGCSGCFEVGKKTHGPSVGTVDFEYHNEDLQQQNMESHILVHSSFCYTRCCSRLF
jgi:hypothetical protein